MTRNEASPDTTRWHPLTWLLVGAAIVLLVGSFLGHGTGLFGWGFMMGAMWLWMLFPLLLLVVLVLALAEHFPPTQQT